MYNFIHLDFKGIAPEKEELCRFLKWFRAIGFNGVVLEYDCRFSWRSWPGAGTPLYSEADITEIGEFIHQLGLECIPLIQSIGHLGWALHEERYAAIREMGEETELCPLHPDSLPRILSWLDEAVKLHPHSRYIHLGADETTHLGSCPRCRAAASPENPLKNYLHHISQLCLHALDKGRRPIIWSDMLWNHPEAAEALPQETVLVNWQYRGEAPFPYIEELRQSGQEVWGASALQCMSPGYEAACMTNLSDRIKNVRNWQKSGLNLIHTTWGRPNNFWTLYPPWAGLIPVFAAAGGTSNEDDDGYFFSMFEEWQSFSNRLEELKREFHFLSDSRCSRKIVRRKYGCISDFVEIDCEEQCKHLGRRIAEWKTAVSEFFKKHALSDGEEFIESRTAFFSISDK